MVFTLRSYEYTLLSGCASWPWYNSNRSDVARFVQGGVAKTICYSATMLPLNDPRWRELRHAYGAGDDVATWLAELRATTPLCHDLSEMHPWESLCHQWTVYPATFAAIPHVVDIVSQHPANDQSRIALLTFVGWCVAIAYLPGGECPPDLLNAYDDAILHATSLICESLPFASTDARAPFGFRQLLASIAACRGDAATAFILSEINESFRCPKCNDWVRLLETTMNPLSATDDG